MLVTNRVVMFRLYSRVRKSPRVISKIKNSVQCPMPISRSPNPFDAILLFSNSTFASMGIMSKSKISIVLQVCVYYCLVDESIFRNVAVFFREHRCYASPARCIIRHLVAFMSQTREINMIWLCSKVVYLSNCMKTSNRDLSHFGLLNLITSRFH